ncbi:MAG: hypothetical protein JJT93_12510, partial [Gammaproteobacteria bacterium]|nr:hypothetical protein [Gammaproteobacteria bacterium]
MTNLNVRRGGALGAAVRRNISSLIAGGVFTAACGALSLPVHAQQPPGSGARQTLDEILVTARRVEEDLQTTPVAVTAITIRDVENRQIVDISAVQNVAPNLLVQPLVGNSGVGINIRGQAGTENTSASDPAVGIYVDGVYTARS